MTTQHTPTPWTIERGREIRGPDNMRQVASIDPYAVPLSLPDAEFIVRACNSHDDLLAALERIEDDADEAMGEWAGIQPPYFPQDLLHIWNIREKARAAIGRDARAKDCQLPESVADDGSIAKES